METVTNLVSSEILTGKKPLLIAGVAIWMVVQKCPLFSKTRKKPLLVQRAMGICCKSPYIKNYYREVQSVEDLILPVSLKSQKIDE